MSNPSEYDKLRKVWYEKLKDDGFDDIEADDDKLKIWSSRFAQKQSVLSWEAKAVYYQMATNFLTDFKFETTRDKNIWTYHANGMSAREITRTLRKVRIKTNRMTVWRTISRLQKLMKQLYGAK